MTSKQSGMPLVGLQTGLTLAVPSGLPSVVSAEAADLKKLQLGDWRTVVIHKTVSTVVSFCVFTCNQPPRAVKRLRFFRVPYPFM